MNWEHVRATAKGALKSLTVWAAALLAIMPEALPIIQQNFSDFEPFIPKAMQSHVMQLIAVGMVLLRIKTTKSLAAKSQP